MVASSKFNMLSAVVGGLMVANADAFGFKGGAKYTLYSQILDTNRAFSYLVAI